MAEKPCKVSNAKFDGKIKFSLWQVQMKNVLDQKSLHKTLKGIYGKLIDMLKED